MMTNLPKYYTLLFGAVEDALDDLDAHNYGAARDRLVTGLQAAEEAYLALGESDRSTDDVLPLTGRQPKLNKMVL